MGLRASDWAASLPLSSCGHAARAVLSLLAVRSNDPGYAAWPSVSTMAESLGVTRRTVQRALVELRDTGLIRAGDQAAVRHLRADRRPAVYDVLTAELREAEAKRRARGARGSDAA